MISLDQRYRPYEVELPYRIAVTVRPLTSAGIASAQAAARRRHLACSASRASGFLR
jgi:hypothetical protein